MPTLRGYRLYGLIPVFLFPLLFIGLAHTFSSTTSLILHIPLGVTIHVDPTLTMVVSPVTVNPLPTISLTPSSTSTPIGTPVTFTINEISGGVGPFDIALFISSTQQGSNVIIASPGGSNTITVYGPSITTLNYHLVVTDTAIPYAFNSTSVAVTFTPNPSVGAGVVPPTTTVTASTQTTIIPAPAPVSNIAPLIGIGLTIAIAIAVGVAYARSGARRRRRAQQMF